jgi:N-acetylmuramoyl-L-alanine amidase
MMQRSHWAAAIFLTLPVIAAPNSGIIQVTGVRAFSHPGSTRVIVETSGPAEFHADRAHDPDRLYFDVLRARPWIDHRRVATREIGDNLVRRVRVAETTPGTTRIVFDLVGQAQYTVSRLDTPDRIVIELTSPVLAPRSSKPAPPVISRITPPRIRSDVRDQKVFVAPITPRHPLPVVAIPDPPPAMDVTAFAPYQLADAWVSLANVRSPRKPVVSQSSAPYISAPANAPFVNTTTRVLPTMRVSASNATAKASTDASLSLTRALGLKINRIVIDAGHGGHDDGTIGPNGVREKDVVLDVALRLAALVNSRLGAEVVLTRSDDTFVPLTERTAIANEHKADLFLSIHANSSPAPAVAGTETFLLNLNSSPGAISVAARENAGSDKSIGELRDLVQSIAQNDKIAESQTFAADIQSSIFTQAAKGNAAAHDRGVKKAPFVVLIGAHMPSVLAEIGFLSNPKDESNLSKSEYRQKIAESLYRGIAEYSQSLSHFEVAGASR